MNRQEIIRMAQEVELINKDYDLGFLNKFTDKVERFAALIEKAVREKINDEAKAHLEELRNNFDVERNQTREQA